MLEQEEQEPAAYEVLRQLHEADQKMLEAEMQELRQLTRNHKSVDLGELRPQLLAKMRYRRALWGEKGPEVGLTPYELSRLKALAHPTEDCIKLQPMFLRRDQPPQSRRSNRSKVVSPCPSAAVVPQEQQSVQPNSGAKDWKDLKNSKYIVTSRYLSVQENNGRNLYSHRTHFEPAVPVLADVSEPLSKAARALPVPQTQRTRKALGLSKSVSKIPPHTIMGVVLESLCAL